MSWDSILFMLVQDMHCHVVVPYGFNREYRSLSCGLAGLRREHRMTKSTFEG
jgi:hypothetical protein